VKVRRAPIYGWAAGCRDSRWRAPASSASGRVSKCPRRSWAETVQRAVHNNVVGSSAAGISPMMISARAEETSFASPVSPADSVSPWSEVIGVHPPICSSALRPEYLPRVSRPKRTNRWPRTRFDGVWAGASHRFDGPICRGDRHFDTPTVGFGGLSLRGGWRQKRRSCGHPSRVRKCQARQFQPRCDDNHTPRARMACREDGTVVFRQSGPG
jgi:hypothetical protein